MHNLPSFQGKGSDVLWKNSTVWTMSINCCTAHRLY